MDCSTYSNSFDTLWYCFSNSMSMEQLLKFALTSKVILSYEIDYLSSFHDRLMQGLWKRSSNGCFYKMDYRHEKLAYIILNENYEAEVEKSLEKLRKMSNRTITQKVFDEMSEPVLCSNESQIVSVEANNAHNLFATNEMSVSDTGILQQGEVVFDKLSEPILSSNRDQVALIGDVDELQPGVNGVPEPYVDGIVPNYAATAHTLFHKMPIPDFILEMAKAANTTQEENEDMADAHQLFDELPLPDFIKEMAQVASIVDEGIPMSEIAEIKTDKGSFEDNIQLPKETRVQQDGCFLHDLVIKGNLCLECPYFKVSIEPFILLNNVQPLNFTKNVVWLSFLDNVDKFMGSRLSMVLNGKVSKPKVFELENDWRPILSFKEAHSWGIQSFCWDCSLLDSSLGKLNSGARLAHIHTAMAIWALFLTLEDKGDFKREGMYAMSTYHICGTLGYVIWPKEYMESISLTWDPGIIDKIAYELIVGCQKDTILLTLWLMKYWATSSWNSDVGAVGFVNFDYLASLKISNIRALGYNNFENVSTSSKMSEMLLGVIEHRFITMRTMLVKNSPRKDPTINCKFSMFMIISSLVFDPGGWKYNLSLIESLTSKFVQTTAIFPSCCLAQLNLLQSSDCADHEVAILVFDPGGYGRQKVMDQPKECQYGGGKRLKNKRNEENQIYVFDPRGVNETFYKCYGDKLTTWDVLCHVLLQVSLVFDP